MAASLLRHLQEVHVSTIRKYRPAVVQKKSPFSLDRTLLAGFVGLGALGLAQPAVMSIAFNAKTPAGAMMAQTPAKDVTVAAKPTADFTPVGTIKPVETKKPVEPPRPAEPPANPHGLRLVR